MRRNSTPPKAVLHQASTAQFVKVKIRNEWPEENIPAGEVLMRLGRVRVGQIISLRYKDKGYACKLVERTKTGIVVMDRNGQREPLKHGSYELEGYLVVKRKPKSSKIDPRLGEIRELEKRLAHLQDTGDITDSTKCFQIEKRIYNLRRELSRDEWPEEIDG